MALSRFPVEWAFKHETRLWPIYEVSKFVFEFPTITQYLCQRNSRGE